MSKANWVLDYTSYRASSGLMTENMSFRVPTLVLYMLLERYMQMIFTNRNALICTMPHSSGTRSHFDFCSETNVTQVVVVDERGQYK